jgi:hypothetical protein
MGDAADEHTAALVAQDPPEFWQRRAIGRRFADHLARVSPGATADLARFEAAITHAPAADLVATTLGTDAGIGTSVRTIEGAQIVMVEHEVTDDALTALDAPAHWIVWRGADGDVRVLAASIAAADAVAACSDAPARLETLGLDPDEAALLVANEILVPWSWDLDLEI